MSIPTPHNTARLGDFAPTVLMPGDPLRSKFIAENFLTDAVLVNNVRGIQGYTGYYNGKRVSVMASGMGIPSMGIYSYELYHFYGVENIIRIGSAGMISQDLKVGSIVAGISAYTTSAFGRQFGFEGNLAPACSYDLLEKAVSQARMMNVPLAVGPIFSSDAFYAETSANAALSQLGVLAVEMEAAGLYLTAAHAGKKALALLTISDNPKTGEGLTAQEREQNFTDMMKIALEIA